MKKVYVFIIVLVTIVACKKKHDNPSPAPVSNCLDKTKLAGNTFKWVNAPSYATGSTLTVLPDSIDIYYLTMGQHFKYYIQYKSNYDSVYIYTNGSGSAPDKYKSEVVHCDTLLISNSSSSYQLVK